ncbi:zf-TFIIB domain-containing protein [Streptomyces fuscichromogenes]|uniref:Uncharacterized protein n=1 Tax=Streptomyces fuscichromogenes TaxID=1324013 RepID=A0A918CY08_9ACTN|nr:zf-TFIIB domain-containing protein [Streptomyces fuscichromogenes]GGN47377.1 hypothetical protein GCM10011578_100950 [Streptomyces fuscichromogenes]
MSVTPPCPECRAATEPIQVEGEDLFRCPTCGRRTYGTDDPDADDTLPPYTEVDEDGATLLYRGNGELDIEATAEHASQHGPDDEDQDDEQPAAATPAGWEPQVQDVRVKDLAHVLTGAWVWIYGDPEGWRFFTSAEYDADRGDTTVTITYSDGEVVREEPWPQARLVRSGPDRVPTATRPGPAGLVRW